MTTWNSFQYLKVSTLQRRLVLDNATKKKTVRESNRKGMGEKGKKEGTEGGREGKKGKKKER